MAWWKWYFFLTIFFHCKTLRGCKLKSLDEKMKKMKKLEMETFHFVFPSVYVYILYFSPFNPLDTSWGWAEVQVGTVYPVVHTTVSVGKRIEWRLPSWGHRAWEHQKILQPFSERLLKVEKLEGNTVWLALLPHTEVWSLWLPVQSRSIGSGAQALPTALVGAGRQRVEPKLIAPNELKYQSDNKKPCLLLFYSSQSGTFPLPSVTFHQQILPRILHLLFYFI